MRKVILGLALSLDNFIEGPNGEYDFRPPGVLPHYQYNK